MTQQAKTYLLGAVGLVVIAGLLWWGNERQAPASSSDQSRFTVGVILPLSGSAAYAGEKSQRGIEVAKRFITEAYPGLDLDVVYGDSQYVPKVGLDVYNNLKAQAKLDAVITAASQVSVTVQPVADSDGILQMAIFSSSDSYSRPHDLSFNMSTRAMIETSRMAKYIAEQQYDTIGIVYLNNEFGVGYLEALQEHLEATPTRIAVSDGYLLETADFRTSITKLKQANPEAVFIVGPATHIGNFLRQARENNFVVPFLSLRSAEDAVLLTQAGDLANGLIYTYPYDPLNTSNEIQQKFVAWYQEQFDQTPDVYAAEGFEGLRLVGQALEQCGEDAPCMAEYLQSLRSEPSLFGSLNYDENGDVAYDYFLKTVRDGEFVRF